MDPRLRCAVDASIGWYEDLCALHGVGSQLADGLWSALGPPPPLHSAAVTAEPDVTADQVLARVGSAPGGIKDSFTQVDLAVEGFDLLFAASWLWRDAPTRSGSPPASWVRVVDEPSLAAWTAGHDTAEVLLPGLLRRGAFAVLAQHDDDGRTVAGAVARLGSGAVDLSNVHAEPGHEVDWDELAAAVAARFPGRPLVGYEHGHDLESAVAGGFRAVGDLRVWVG